MYGPNMIVNLAGGHRRTTLRDLRLLLELQTAVSTTKIVQPHRKPTHLAVMLHHFGKGQGLTHLAPVA